MSKKRKSIYFTQTQATRLEKKSHQENLSEAEIVRRALDVYLAWDDPDYRPTVPTPNNDGSFQPILDVIQP